jgi:hypothetical protein
MEDDRNRIWAEALARGTEMSREILRAEGGVITGPEIAQRLGMTPEAVEQKRGRNELFWLDTPDGNVYPLFQLSGDALLPGIREVLAAFQEPDPWARVWFMLSGDYRLDGRRPLDVLREGGRISDVVRAANAYGEQGAA